MYTNKYVKCFKISNLPSRILRYNTLYETGNMLLFNYSNIVE